MPRVKQKSILPKIIVICGPTATGKSNYAVKLAKKTNGEIVSADSRQVYRHMNLGTGKITRKEMHGIRHHLLDVADPRNIFSVNSYVNLARRVIKDIHRRGKMPIVCGGTGFYIDTLIHSNKLPSVPPNRALRALLYKKSIEELFAQLHNLDYERARTIDKHNKVRLTRALEIIGTLGYVPKIDAKNRKLTYSVKWIYRDISDTKLKKRIHSRLLQRIKNGMFREIQNLHRIHKVPWERMEALGLEYRYGSRYERNLISKDECIEKLEKEIWQYARRQRTWFRKYKI